MQTQSAQEFGVTISIVREPHKADTSDVFNPIEARRLNRWAREENEEDVKLMRRSLNAFIDRFNTPVAYTVTDEWTLITIDAGFDSEREAQSFANRAQKLVAGWAKKGIKANVS